MFGHLPDKENEAFHLSKKQIETNHKHLLHFLKIVISLNLPPLVVTNKKVLQLGIPVKIIDFLGSQKSITIDILTGSTYVVNLTFDLFLFPLVGPFFVHRKAF